MGSSSVVGFVPETYGVWNGFPALGSTVPSAVANPRTGFGCRAPPRYRSTRAGQVAGAFAPRPLLANTRHTVLGEAWISRAIARTW